MITCAVLYIELGGPKARSTAEVVVYTRDAPFKKCRSFDYDREMPMDQPGLQRYNGSEKYPWSSIHTTASPQLPQRPQVITVHETYIDKELEYSYAIIRHTLLRGKLLQFHDDSIHLLIIKQSWYLSRVQNAVNILEKHLL